MKTFQNIMLALVISLLVTLPIPVTVQAQSTLRGPTITSTGLLNLTWTAGTVNNGGHAVAIVAGTTNGTASRSDCAAPTYTTCGWLYANSAGTVANTTTLATAAASGNTILAMYESNGTALTKVSFPLQNSGVGLAGLGVMTSPTLITPNIGAATGTSLDLTGSVNVGLAGTTVGTVVFENATSGSITMQPPTGALGSATLTLPSSTGALATGFTCGASLAAAGACANTSLGGNAHFVVGSALLSGSTSTITGFSPAFTSATSWWCVANDVTTRANPVQMIPASASTATITNTTGATDLIQYICAGN